MSTIEFNDILLQNADFLKPFAVNLTRDKEAANDLCQETLYKALANKEKYHVGTNIRAWLFTIMRNIFINDYRKKINHRIINDNTPNAYFLNLNQVTVNNDAESDLHLKEVKIAIHELQEIFKTPFLLYFDGYKYNDIALALQEPLGTIKSRIHFARKLLKERISRF